MNAVKLGLVLCLTVGVFLQGSRATDCTTEHGHCSAIEYYSKHSVALVSSGCASFCQCATYSTQPDGSVLYYWVQQTCPQTTLFDNTYGVCNHAFSVTCSERQPTRNPTTPGPPRPSGMCQREHGTCTDDIYRNVRLLALRSTLCREFCQCAHASTQPDGSVTNYWVSKMCPPGTLFDERIHVCTWAPLVHCSQSPDVPPVV